MTVFTATATLTCNNQSVEYVYRGAITGTGDHFYRAINTADMAPRAFGTVFLTKQNVSGSNDLLSHSDKDPGEVSGARLRGWGVAFSSDTCNLIVVNGAGTQITHGNTFPATINSDNAWHSWCGTRTDTQLTSVRDANIATAASTAITGYLPASNSDTFYVNGGINVNRNYAMMGFAIGDTALTSAQMVQWQQDCKTNTRIMPFPVGTTIIYQGADAIRTVAGAWAQSPWVAEQGPGPNVVQFSGSTLYPVYNEDAAPTWGY